MNKYFNTSRPSGGSTTEFASRIYFPRQFNNLIESRALGSGRSLARQVKTRVARPSKATPDLSQHVLPLPEALRIKGDVLVLSDRSHATAPEDSFPPIAGLGASAEGSVLGTAHHKSLARLQHAQGRSRDARDLLKPVYARFTEGFETADLQGARLFLEELT
jgi:hypothetical protein